MFTGVHMTWPVAEAKNRLSEVMRRALTEGPQRIARRDGAVIVLAEAEYRRLTGEKPSLVSYLMQGPSLDGVDLKRDASPIRPVDL
ncbi:type II toxin-antitoxin system Phd/YefM family antitoxin [Rubrimonas sp.]|uniref:type II toxin-antitoxin system Phd/YefM family antitoxin n=1 Tax=Rubrimonas sp. TaxID=2036015 RepID=UPI002FDD5A7B